MVEMKSYDPGVPSWVDVSSRDLPATVAFYKNLFGWDSFEPPGGGGYTMFLQGGKQVCAAGPAMDPNAPEAWTTYVSVVDADATAAAVKDAGGTVLAGPFDVMDAGRMAVFMDDGGAVFSIWQPGAHPGAAIVNEPVSLSWTELASGDIEKSKVFYGRVFGWASETNQMGDMTYTEFKVAGRSIAGMLALGPMHPPGTPPHWLVYFAVADADATIARTVELGGKALSPAVDIPIGRFAALADARGAVFAVIKLAAA
jgi:predicted enzyme related to lactoylglutathione lyase